MIDDRFSSKIADMQRTMGAEGEQNISIHLIGRYLGNKFTMEIARGGGSSTPINSPFPLNIKALIWTMIEIIALFWGATQMQSI